MSFPRGSRPRKDRMSVDIVPEQSVDIAIRCPDLQRLFEDYSEAKAERCSERCIWRGSDSSDDDLDDDPEKKATETLMQELADWLAADDRDYRPGSRTRLSIKQCPTLKHVNKQFTTYPIRDSSVAFDTLSLYIAVQLLASCYTILPASSAHNLPFYQQRRRPTLVTALRFHSWYRFSPASGHHARENSETSSWPGLYKGMTVEDQLAESTSKRRAREGGWSQQGWSTLENWSWMSQSNTWGGSSGPPDEPASPVHGFQPLDTYGSGLRILTQSPGASAWSDGPASRTNSNGRGSTHSSTSTSSGTSQGLFTRLLCQRKPKKHRTFPLPYPHLHKTNSKEQASSRISSSPARRSPVRSLSALATQLGTSRVGLQRSQSMPRKSSQETTPASGVLDTRRNSSTPNLATHLFALPEIRRTSATTVGQHSTFTFDRGDSLTAQEYLDETRLSPSPDIGFSFAPSASGSFGPGTSPAISPMGTTDAIPMRTSSPGPRPTTGEYFGPMAFAPQEHPEEDNGNDNDDNIDNDDEADASNLTELRRGIDLDNFHMGESRCGPNQRVSEDSIDFMDKRRNLIFNSQDFGDLAVHWSRRRSQSL